MRQFPVDPRLRPIVAVARADLQAALATAADVIARYGVRAIPAPGASR